mgnify:CR=1 FL=1
MSRAAALYSLTSKLSVRVYRVPISKLRTKNGLGFILMLCVALTTIHFWLRNAYFFYILCLILIVLVEVFGTVGMGARRWIDLGVVAVQPSEFMKIMIILALARYFYASQLGDVKRLTHLIIPPYLMQEYQ